MKTDFTYPSADGISTIHASLWSPDTAPRAILLLCHGMAEHIGRYDDFARYLAARGFLVAGNDHLGHGGSLGENGTKGYFGHPNGDRFLVDDFHTLRLKVCEESENKGLPCFLLGHSMGSFISRRYLMTYGSGLAGCILMGTGSQPAFTLALGKTVCNFLALFFGWKHPSNFVNFLAFSPYLKKIRPRRTVMDWVTRDTAVVDEYIASPLCGFTFTLDGFYQLFSEIAFIQKRENIRKTPRNFPILLVSGDADPVGNYGAGVKKVFDDYGSEGITDVEMKFFPDDRHELLNELDRDNVYEYLGTWLENALARQTEEK